MDKLININFRKNYFGFRKVSSITPEEESFITDNDFIFVVTDKTKNNGYSYDSDKVAEYLTVGTEYTLKAITVHQSSTDIWLEEIPDIRFNSVNFEVIETRPKSDGKK